MEYFVVRFITEIFNMWWIWVLGIIGLLTLTDWLTFKWIEGNKHRSGEIRVTKNFTIYKGYYNLGFEFEPEYDNEEYMQLVAHSMWHSFFVHFPWWKVPTDANKRWENKTYRFGGYLYNPDPKSLFNQVVLFWKNWSKTIYMPWDLDCHHVIIEGKDGKKYIEFCDEWKKRRVRAKKYGCRPLSTNSLSDIYSLPSFYWEAPYEYICEDGTLQRCIGMYYVAEREWRPKATYYLPIFRHRRRCLEIELTSEIGEAAGSWKGGCTAFGREMLPGEDPHTAYQRIMKEAKF